MEYRTKVTLASTLLAVLTLTAVLGWAFSQQAVVARQAEEPLLAGYQISDVTGLEIGNGVSLKKDKTWTLTYQGKSYPASADRVETYLKTLSSLRRERLATRDGDGKAFGLESGFRTLKVVGAAGKPVADLQVGSTNDLGDKAYVRFSGTKEVWQTDSGFSRTLDMDFNTWADLTLFPGRKAGDLTRISFDSRIETADKTVYAPFDLTKTTKDGKSVWEDRISKTSTQPMASWTDLVSTFHFGAFAGPAEAPIAGASLGTVSFWWTDGNQSTVKIYPADGQGRYRATDGVRDFWINDWALGQILFK